MVQWIYSFSSNVIFMIPVQHTFQSYCHNFVNFDNTSIFGLVFPNSAAGFPAAIFKCSTQHCCWRRTFQLSTSIFDHVSKSSSSSSMKKMPHKLLAWSFVVFRWPVFAMLFAESEICFHISVQDTCPVSFHRQINVPNSKLLPNPVAFPIKIDRTNSW